MGSNEIWVLGATGRIGRSIVDRLAAHGVKQIVIVGRSAEQLATLASSVDAPLRPLVSASFTDSARLVAEHGPGVVVNAAGSYAGSAVPIARAVLGHGHYVDLANDLAAFQGLQVLNAEAIAAGSSLITGAGFGVVGTEALVAHLCSGRPAPRSVAIDALASVATEAGPLGAAFAATMVDVLATGGRAYHGGRLVRQRLGTPVRHLTTPDGFGVSTAGVPTGELLAAHNASAAAEIVATSALAPTSPWVRMVLPVIRPLMAVPALRSALARRLAGTVVPATARPRPHSWGHAVVEWADGTRTEGWLRADDGMDFTADVAAAVALRLAGGEAPAGTHTPAAAFGPGIATAAGAHILAV